MSAKITIGPDLSLPRDAVTQTFGILAVRGAGKSNLAAVMAEGFFDAGIPFVVIDPVGAWWGLRANADGSKSRITIPIFGGRHGDIPLEERGGVVIADAVADERLSCIIDISELSESAKIRFLIDFAERLYRRNSEPLHLFLEEADDYCPQRPFREQARLLRSWENIVRRGRARGLGMTMISQRSAALNKNVLTQIETLFVLRTTSPQDRKAIAAWVEYHDASRELLTSLSGLANGEAWVWSPAWLKVVDRFQVPRRQTFDSGATPKMSEGKRSPATLADIDLGALTKRMAETIEKAKKEDPRELRKMIAELEKQRRMDREALDAARTRPGPDVPILKEAEIARLEKVAVRLIEAAKHLVDIGQQMIDKVVAARMPAPNQSLIRIRTETAYGTRPGKRETFVKAPTNGDASVNGPQQAILDAIAFFNSVGIDSPTREQVAFMARVSSVSSGYEKNLSTMRTAGMIDYPAGGLLALTDFGRALVSPSMSAPNIDELQEAVYRRISAPQAAILKVLMDAYPKAMDREKLAERANQSETSSGFEKNLSRLRSLGLIHYPSRGEAAALPVLFLE